MEFLIAAISLGFLGSFHCIGMCGPIALALPVHTMSLPQKMISVFAYNFGRIITYSLFGALFGLIGQSFFLFGFQQKLSLILGLIILLGLLFSGIDQSKFSGKIYSTFNKLKASISSQFQKRGIKTFFSIGLLNGLLPCGLVYLGVAGAIATGSILKGALFMAAFGAGTWPFMMAISYSSHLITLKTRTVIRKMMPIVIATMAILLVLRGLNLGIKYVSPSLTEDKTVSTSHQQQIKCCHKN